MPAENNCGYRKQKEQENATLDGSARVERSITGDSIKSAESTGHNRKKSDLEQVQGGSIKQTNNTNNNVYNVYKEIIKWGSNCHLRT